MAKKDEKPVFDKATLLRSAAVLETAPEIVAGALFDMTADEKITLDEARAKVKAFLGKPVEQEKGV